MAIEDRKYGMTKRTGSTSKQAMAQPKKLNAKQTELKRKPLVTSTVRLTVRCAVSSGSEKTTV